MDTQGVNSTGNPTVPKLKHANSSPLTGKGSSPVPNQDTVNLSQEAQRLAQQDEASAKTTNYAMSLELFRQKKS
jgi:hypothetical protein